MKSWFFVLVVTVGATLLATTVLGAPVVDAAQGIQRMFVTNTASNPVPVREERTDRGGNVRVHEQGTANVKVLGAVASQPAIPAAAFDFARDLGGGPLAVVSGPNPPGTEYAISSVTVTNRADQWQSAIVVAYYGANQNCQVWAADTASLSGPEAVVPARDTVHLDFPQPFVIKAPNDAISCLLALGPSLTKMVVVGYRL